LLGLKKADAKVNLDEISATATEAINDVREIAYNLGPFQLERIGLKNTIEEMIQKIANSAAIEFHTEIDEIDGCLVKESEINVFRIVQEIASNVVKHSDAHDASLKIKKSATQIILTMRDNGRGFVLGNSREERGFGLLGMSERVNLLKGELTINSEIEKGTTVEIIVPCGENQSNKA